MLEPVRQYAAERLIARPDRETIHARHLGVYLRLAESMFRVLWLHGASSAGFLAVHAERDNFRAALTWAEDGGHWPELIALVGALEGYWHATGADVEARTWYERAFAGPTDSAAVEHLARAYRGYATLRVDETAVMVAAAGKGLELYRQLGDDHGIALCLVELSSLHMMEAERATACDEAKVALQHAQATGDAALAGFAKTRLALASVDLRDAAPLLEEGIRALRDAGALDRVARTLAIAAWLALVREAYDYAEALLDDALAAAGETQDAAVLAHLHGNRGVLALLCNRPEHARDAFETQIRVAAGNALAPVFYDEALLGFAALAAGDGRPELAATLEAASHAHTLRVRTANEAPVYGRVITRYLEPVRERLGAQAWERAAARGSALTSAAALELALGLARHRVG
jgi:hypothetical protein